MSSGTAAPVGDGGSADVLSRDAPRPPWGEMRSSTAWCCALLEDVCPRALEGRGLEQAAEMTLNKAYYSGPGSLDLHRHMLRDIDLYPFNCVLLSEGLQ